MIDIAAFGVLATVAVEFDLRRGLLRAGPHQLVVTSRRTMVAGRWVVTALTIQASVVLGVLFAAAGSASTIVGVSAVALTSANVNGTVGLINDRGDTLHWLASDTRVTTVGNGTRDAYCQLVVGDPSLAAGVIGRVKTFRRTDGAVYDT